MAKIGRNSPCPCGSGKKYKRCHGSQNRQSRPTIPIHDFVARAEALRVQRERQQGMGRPIVSTEAFGRRFIAVKNRLMHSEKWRTFHDFLGDHIKMAMGQAWGNAELAKPLEQRHPILVWYHHVCQYQRQFVEGEGKIRSAPMTGAAAAYMHLAYDLYVLDHNAELQKKLVKRLQDKNNFQGARYEVFVAATLIRAGFTIEFENEDDFSTSHCEFSATFTGTGKRFSVEAKHRSGENRFRLGRRLNNALAKKANHQRIVFIDINVPDATTDDKMPVYLKKALDDLRTFEGRIVKSNPLPSAYLVVTNTPWQHHLETKTFRSLAMAEGFQIPEFKIDAAFPSLRAAINARERHIEMHELMRSMKDHADIPSTFDGEIPEFAFGNESYRLLIGNRYLVKDNEGNERIGLLTSAIVDEDKRKAICVLSLDSGTSAICTMSLSDLEITAWRRHPDTFFGEVGQRTSKLKNPLDLYDFFHNSYRQTPKERLLELMAGMPDSAGLRQIDQSALASMYAERMANAVMANDKIKFEPPARKRNRT
ncbi:MAG: SEC-C domain-containing protein [Nitrospinae bacterium]|nr:SEC-C domain-containing protein [Nitrospinota bacterium]